MSEKKVATFAELEAADGIEYDTFEAYGTIVRIGSLSSGDMLEWVESNEDKDRKREAGLRLLVKSVVNADGARISKEQHDHWMGVFRKKGTKANGLVIERILKLNGLDKARGAELIKNASGEGASGDSPTGLPSPRVM